MKEPIIKRFEEEGSPYYSSARYIVLVFIYLKMYKIPLLFIPDYNT